MNPLEFLAYEPRYSAKLVPEFGHVAAAKAICEFLADRCLEEFFAQGDQEKEQRPDSERRTTP